MRNKRNQIIGYLSFGLILIAAVWALYWVMFLRFKVSTTNGYVNGNRIVITPQLSGIITAIHVDDTDYVKEGDVLVELDDTTYRLAYEKAKHSLAETVRSVVQLFIQAERMQAEVRIKKRQLQLAQEAFDRRLALVELGGVSQEEVSRAATDLDVAQASIQEAICALQEIEAFTQNTTVATHPNVKKMATEIREAYLNLQRCQILSPVSGCVAQKRGQLGEGVTFGQPLLEVIPLDTLWVEANYKETQLSKIQVGQKAILTSDLYGKDVVYHGDVLGVQPGTGSVFALLPPQNASGNWIKIVQRVPVRISLDPVDLQQHPLFLGLSMQVVIDRRLALKQNLDDMISVRSRYKTSMYREQADLIESIIQEIILNNSQKE